jgi:hypothetical protein
LSPHASATAAMHAARRQERARRIRSIVAEGSPPHIPWFTIVL